MSFGGALANGKHTGISWMPRKLIFNSLFISVLINTAFGALRILLALNGGVRIIVFIGL